MSNFPSDEEIKTFYTLFCKIFSAFLNYATAIRLSKNKNYTWSLVAYYYSLMHCGRAICFMSFGSFPTGHTDLYKLLSGESVNNRKFWRLGNPEGVNESHDFSELIRNLPTTSNRMESQTKELGKYLEKVKKIREFNSYEMFIMAHQIDHPVLSPRLLDGIKILRKIVREYLTFVMNLLFEYAEAKGEYFKAFVLDKNPDHEWAFKYLFLSLKKQKFGSKIIGEIEKIIKDNLLSKISVQIVCPEEFYNPISIQFFDDKIRIMSNFGKDIQELQSGESNP